ncbi:MAG: NAD(P)H-dependent oxidoreductase [Ruminiclostridium sp.]|nr:NAD(P)H-dependent oxidoreductase [Ruminiclostridium sp.]
MKILTIMGTPHKGNTRAVTDLFLDEFRRAGCELDEIVLPNDFGEQCRGCAACILNGEDKCPHHDSVAPILDRIKRADLIILASPVFVYSCTGSMKSLLDHLAYIWLVHRPEESMFRKAGLIITSAGGSGVKDTVKLLKNNLFFWGVPKVWSYGVTTMKMNGNYADYKDKDKIIAQVKKKAAAIIRAVPGVRPGFRTRFFYGIFKMTQKNGWNKTDSDYWKSMGWLDGKKPF